MILIKTEDNLINFNNLVNIYISGDRINILQIADVTETVYTIYRNKNKELLQKVYNIIQKQIIELNNGNKSGCVDVDYIATKLEDNTISLTNKPF